MQTKQYRNYGNTCHEYFSFELVVVSNWQNVRKKLKQNLRPYNLCDIWVTVLDIIS